MVYSTDRSKAVVPMLVLLFVALWLFYEAICFMSYLVLFSSCVFGPFSITITSLGEERAKLSAMFDLRLFGFVCCLFLLVSGKGCCM